MSSAAARLTALVLAGVLAFPPGLASADDPADLRGSIIALRQSLAQLREPPNLMLERNLSPLEWVQRRVGIVLRSFREENVGQYGDLWLQARNHQSFAALEAAIAEDLLDAGDVESARKHLGYASANLRARHLYDEAASDVWQDNLAHAQGVLLEAGKTVTSSLGLLGKVLESSKVKTVSEAGLALQGESLVLELGLDYAFHGMPTPLANLFYAAGEQKVVEWAANALEVDPTQAELARSAFRTGQHAGQLIAHLAAKVSPSAELQALIEEELRKLPADAQESVDQALRVLARLRGRPATEAVARPRPTPPPSPTPTPAPTPIATPDPNVLVVQSDKDVDTNFVGQSAQEIARAIRASTRETYRFPLPFDPRGLKFELTFSDMRAGGLEFKAFTVTLLEGTATVMLFSPYPQIIRREALFVGTQPRYLVQPVDPEQTPGFITFGGTSVYLEVPGEADVLLRVSDIDGSRFYQHCCVGTPVFRVNAGHPPLPGWTVGGDFHIFLHGKGLGGFPDLVPVTADSLMRAADGRIVYIRN